jgi:hypothetical protein
MVEKVLAGSVAEQEDVAHLPDWLSGERLGVPSAGTWWDDNELRCVSDR